ncbi:SusC/RagA family TonB-linked outer membrane protein [Sediminitomix flava]|uniref:TonB-linked SusC/RagA family outer membrane protein n=1 Tax=Sediminitomix flava TaxID=379075 RepID=A0A315Z8J9_SEDFL|nr:TonB-dependent receptor [Sediminitomix flava]PWJ41906.1 TonB-linked SusC/RagA family outer membrane protein [Sediminitomix flava]
MNCNQLKVILPQKWHRALIFLGVFMLNVYSIPLLAEGVQDRVIKGTITDGSDGTFLVGAYVLLKGTSTGTITDFDGEFSISVPQEGGVLVFSSVGYKSQEVEVLGQTEINVTLEVDVQQLEEIVVVGYGTQERAKVTGAVATVGSAEITSVPVYTADQALQGRAPGVMVSNNGSPGNDPIVQIRGVMGTSGNSPLIVVDGIIVQGLGDLNPSDIENMTVLKDAATTAIYGAQGANGVVLVTTKKGKTGEITIDVDGYTGVQSVNQRYNVMNRDEYIQYAGMWENPASGRLDNPKFMDISKYDTNWQDEIFQTGKIENYNVGLSGGSENATYRISTNYMNQDGVLKNTGIERYMFRANSSYTKNKLNVNQTFSVSYTDKQPEQTSGGRSALEHAIKMPPYLTAYNASNLGGFQGTDVKLDGQDAENPLRVLEHTQISNRRVNMLGTLSAEYEILPGLTAKGQAGMDYFSYKNELFSAAYNDGSALSRDRALIERAYGEHSLLTLIGQMSYIKSFGKHNINAIAVAERIEKKSSNAGMSSFNEITNEIENITNVDLTGGSFETIYGKLGYLGRLNYDYDGRYLFAASYRYDASSRFGTNNRWAGFYSVSAGWNIADEAFFPETDAVSQLKLRGSYGSVGNDNIGDYRYSASIMTGNHNYIFQGNNGLYQTPGSTAGNLPNPNLKWETTFMTNIGIDLGLFEDRFTLSAEYYKNESNDLLINVSQVSSIGGVNSTQAKNAGGAQVSGVEVNLGVKNFDKAFKWSANLNLSTMNNKVNDLGGETLYEGYYENNGSILRSVEGEPLRHFYGYEVAGIFRSWEEIYTSAEQTNNTAPGDIKYRDQNNDGVIDENDRVVIGNPTPDLVFGFSLDFSYKNFDLNMFLNGTYGNEIYNTTLWYLEGGQRFFNAEPKMLNAWTPENPDSNVPRLNSSGDNLRTSDRFVEDGSYVRLKNITLGYTIPSQKISKYISRCRLYMSAQNLFTLTNYSGLDPEVGAAAASGNNPAEMGIDRGNYPTPVTIIGGLQLNF